MVGTLDEKTRRTIVTIVVVVLVLYLISWLTGIPKGPEGYERPVVGGSYGAVPNEIFWYPYPSELDFEEPATRYAKFSPSGELFSLSFVNPDHDTTVNEPHNCKVIPNPPAFAGQDIVSMVCPQEKYHDSGR